MKKTYLIKTCGKVQGVGFRNYVYRISVLKSVTGIVRNDEDGTCTIIANIEEDELDDYIREIQRGNGFSEVSCIRVSELEGASYPSFVVEYKNF